MYQQQHQQQQWVTQFAKCGLEEGCTEFSNFKKIFEITTARGVTAQKLNTTVRNLIGYGEVRYINGKDMLCGWIRHGQPTAAVPVDDDDDLISLRQVRQYDFDKRSLTGVKSQDEKIEKLEKLLIQCVERLQALEADNVSLRCKLRESQMDLKRAFAEIDHEFAVVDENFSRLAGVINQ